MAAFKSTTICFLLLALFAANILEAQAKSIVEFLHVNQDAKIKFVALGAKCMNEHKPSQQVIQDLRNLKFTEDKAVKCYINCLMSGFQLYDGNKFNEDKVRSIVEDKDKQMAVECTKQSGADACDTVFLFYKCLMINFHKQ